MATTYRYDYIGEQSSREQPMLLTFSKVKNGPAGETKPHAHTYLEIFAFESGRGYFESGKEKIELKAGDFLVVDAGVRHVQYSGGEAPLVYDCFAVVCKTPVTDAGFARVSGDGELSALVEFCRRELLGAERERVSAANAYFQLLLIGLLRRIAPRRVEREQSVAEQIRIYIEAHCDEELSLDRLAGRFYINKTTLLHTFKRELGTSPLQYRNAYRIERAKILLNGGMRVTDVALAVGFSNPVYFSEVFRKNTGMTPSAYQREREK